MRSRLTAALVLGSLLALVAGAAVAEDRAADLLAKKLAEFPGAERGQVLAITSPPLAGVFPNYAFYARRFRQYPVAIAPPEPLQANNLFVVRPDGAVDHLANVAALEAFFRAALHPATTDAEARDAARAWLLLVEEFRQDGFLRFSIPDDSLKVVSLAGRRARGDRQGAGHAPRGESRRDLRVADVRQERRSARRIRVGQHHARDAPEPLQRYARRLTGSGSKS